MHSYNMCTANVKIIHIAMMKVSLAAIAVVFSEAYETSTSAWVVFKWLYLPLTSRQLAVIHHTIG